MKIIKQFISRIRGEQSLQKLIRRGLIIGRNPCIMSGCIIDPSHCWHIKIGDDVVIAPNVHILAHDSGSKLFLNYTRIANVTIGNKVFIGAGSIILPGVSIGDNVIIGAGSVVTHNIVSNSVAIGVPAKVITTLETYLERKKTKMQPGNVFNSNYTLRNHQFSNLHKIEMKEACDKYGEAFVE